LAEYDAYEAAVNRIVPSLSSMREAFAGMRFDWRRSIKKDLGTVAGLTIGLNLVPVWRTYFIADLAAAKAAAIRGLLIVLAITAVYLVMLKLKRSKRLFHESPIRRILSKQARDQHLRMIRRTRRSNISFEKPIFHA
jgi:hypothetical protein